MARKSGFCIVGGECSEGFLRRGLCCKHYNQFKRMGVLELVAGDGSVTEARASLETIGNVIRLWNGRDEDAVKAFLFSLGVKVW